MENIVDELQILQQSIGGCRICAEFADELGKSQQMDRGNADGPVMIIGEGPGRTELKEQRAFSGQSGKRLDEWLVSSGADQAEPRRGVYLTSVLKCSTTTSNLFPRMAKNCFKFLEQQLLIVRPQLIITLGANAYDFLRFSELRYDAALCQVFCSSDYYLFPPYWDGDFDLLVWPHPSGLNRWLNEGANLDRLHESFDYVRPLVAQ